MPRGRNTTLPASSNHTGWYRDGVNNVLEWYNSGTKVGQASGATVTYSGAVNVTGVTTYNAQLNVATGFNIRLGGLEAFSGTAPTNTLVIKTGTAPSGTITTSVGLFTDGVTMKKIIADNTVSDVQT